MTSQILASYAVSHRGKHDRKPYAMVRFHAPTDPETLLNRLLPGPEHVARYLTAPALEGTDPTLASASVRELLATMPHRMGDGRGGEVSTHYEGLHAAVHWIGPSGFDRDAYLDAIAAATTTALQRMAATATRAARRATRDAAPHGPVLAPAEVKARFNANRVAREHEFALGALRRHIGTMAPGATLSRADAIEIVLRDVTAARDLLEEVRVENADAERRYTAALAEYREELADWEHRRRMQPDLDADSRPVRPPRPVPLRYADEVAEFHDELPTDTPPSFGARRAASLVIELAPELGLVERRSGNVRRYVYTPTDTIDTPEETPVNVTDATLAQAAAVDVLAESVTRAGDAYERLLELQHAAHASGDLGVALTVHAERYELAGAPSNVTPLRPRARAA